VNDAEPNNSGSIDILIDECVKASRLLGGDQSLVLHGGGNTSVKAPFLDITGAVIDALYVKGSGWDLASIEAPGFAPLPLQRMHALLELEQLSDADMMRELSAARLDPVAPQPSVEALLHAYLPHQSVLHSHADLILMLTNLRDGDSLVREVFGDRVIYVPYVMPGFELAREVKRRWETEGNSSIIGMVLMNHGLFTFAETAEVAYANHIGLIGEVETYLASVPASEREAAAAVPHICATELAKLRHQLSEVAGRPMILSRDTSPETLSFVGRNDLADVAGRGPVTPDHVIRTKRTPMIGQDISAYATDYRGYFDENKDRAASPVTMLDPAPRVVLDPSIGMLTAGIQARDAAIANDIYRHTMAVISTCEDRLGGWVPLSADHLFDVEYWDLEQAKLRLSGPPPSMAGQIGVVTGSASGIGKACAAALLDRGAAVIGMDIADDVELAFDGPAWCGIKVDITDADAHREALATGIDRFGGVDIVVMAAGIFGASTPIGDLEADDWRRVMSVNVDAVAEALRQLHPILVLSPVGGRVAMIGSKNVSAPGAGAAAYSASKAALTQLARVAAIEWAADGIRVNTVHPDAVFDTGLWTDDLLASRAEKYGLTVDGYKRRNLLQTEVTTAVVGEAVALLCSDSFAATTGAQIPIDGGNERTI
jgi:rhamnose utilization protein RhaD (predicted bifunctional aldolase and dehydrogenase)/NAD(P)-dependent dehydrogenase (short-subunit alcohol dehydrogenase family)